MELVILPRNLDDGEAGRAGVATASGAEISPEKRDPERRSFHDAVLRKVLAKAVQRLNPGLPEGIAQEVVVRVTDEVFAGDLIAENRLLHGLMTRGVSITYFSQGKERNDRARLVDWDDPENAWQAFNLVDMRTAAANVHLDTLNARV